MHASRLSLSRRFCLQMIMPMPSTEEPTAKSMSETLKVGSLFGLWYALNIGYNISNKKVLNIAPALTWTTAWLQLFIGLFYVVPLWLSGMRAHPVLSTEEVKSLMPVAVLHLLTHMGAVISLSAGTVAFTHIVKAAEPAVSAGLSVIFLRQCLHPVVYLSLLPVMGGVAIASLKELSFTWLSFSAAMVSNVASALRGIVGKTNMGSSIGKNMDAANMYAVMTILVTMILFPFALAKEGPLIMPTINSLIEAGQGMPFLSEMILSGLFYFLYNEVAFLCLDNVAPLTHALGNTIKRVVIIIVSVIVFGTNMTAQGALGSAIAIFGVLLYSMAKNKYK